MTIRSACAIAAAVMIAACGTSTAGTKGNTMNRSVRRPAVAGQFYTSDPDELRREIEAYLAAASPPAVHGEIKAIVSPNAGYVYSGA